MWWEVTAERREADFRQREAKFLGLLRTPEPTTHVQNEGMSKGVLCSWMSLRKENGWVANESCRQVTQKIPRFISSLPM